MKKSSKTWIIILAIIVLALAAYGIVRWRANLPVKIDINRLVTMIHEQKVTGLVVDQNRITIYTNDKKKYQIFKDEKTSIFELLQFANIDQNQLRQIRIEVKPSSGNLSNTILVMLSYFFILIIIFLLFNFLRASKATGDQAITFTKWEDPSGSSSTTRFQDIAGYRQAKQEILEIVDYLCSADVFKQIGIEIPKTILMVGPPGIGKTMLVRALANSVNIPVFYGSGSQFVELFVGVGAARVRDLFNKAKKKQPAIIFIDELDALGRKRAVSLSSNHEQDNTLNELLVQLDGFMKDDRLQVIFIGATNREDVLDPALIQRMNRRMILNLPNQFEREAIIKKHTQNKSFQWENRDDDIQEIALQTAGFSGRELKDLIQESAHQVYYRLFQEIQQKCQLPQYKQQKPLLVTPVNNETENNPVQFGGWCPPGAKVTLEIYPNIKKEVIDYDEDGIWMTLVSLPSKTHEATAFLNNQRSTSRFKVVTTPISIQTQDVSNSMQKLGAIIPKIDDPLSVTNALDKWVCGQEKAKSVLASAAVMHYTAARHDVDQPNQPNTKSNVLFIGPSGSGKTYLARNLAKYLRVPFASIDVTRLDGNEAGVSAKQFIAKKLLQSAMGNVQRAQHGIICFEGLNKLAGNTQGEVSVWSHHLQELLLEYVHGEKINLNVNDEGMVHKTVLFDTQNILFICEGDFKNPIHEHRDLIQQGLLADLVSSFSLLATLHPLTISEFQTILDPTWEGNCMNEYKNLLKDQGIEVEFLREALELIADKAMRKGLGGRGIDLIMQKICARIVERASGKPQNTPFAVDSEFVLSIFSAEETDNFAMSPAQNMIDIDSLEKFSPKDVADILL